VVLNDLSAFLFALSSQIFKEDPFALMRYLFITFASATLPLDYSHYVFHGVPSRQFSHFSTKAVNKQNKTKQNRTKRKA